jgi:lipopolysaccharide/colanic/teichoic acid biosynthesis glycosyltransferase
MPLLIQRATAAFGLLILSPVVAIIAIAVRATSSGPVIHRAPRVGRFGQPFVVLKFRTMTPGSEGSAVTAAGDTRVTSLGRLLRRTKLDELPQLWNVARGEMAIVGPRPEDPRYVDPDDSTWQEVLSIPPGMTGPTVLEYVDEEARLAAAAAVVAEAAGRQEASSMDIDEAYRAAILPAKLRLDAEYVRSRSPGGDFRIMIRTIGLVLARATRP